MPGRGRRQDNPEGEKPRSGKSRWVMAFEEVVKDIKVVGPDAPSEDPKLVNVQKVHLDIANNTKQHNTNDYEITDCLEGDNREFLVIRRGQKFNMKIEFDREYNKEVDDLRIVFQFGSNPHPTKGTHAEFILSHRDVTNEWGAYIESQDSKTISLVVMSPSTCPVGKWRLGIDVVSKSGDTTSVVRYAHPDEIYILFNPWCKNDQVYFHETKEEKLLNEYVLNETGHIYVGSASWPGKRNWTFGQFTGNVLDCILYLLDDSLLKDEIRGDPVKVSRTLSALINIQGDNGVLVGNWSGEYDDGTSPLKWNGSTAILEQYYEQKSPVSYGQCWVFSGVLTTACRAIGIPARSVTNFSSAHDTDGSVSIDKFEDKDGEPIEYLNNDSVWNFHVWNDVWMARPDLPAGYGGWQAIDATPQETSDGVYCMGPVSLEAVKRGEVLLKYDGPFLFAEINADRVTWRRNEDGKFEVRSITKTSVGQKISTKKPFNIYIREDVTDQYKYAEGTVENRAAVQKANLASSVDRKVFEHPTLEDVKFEHDASKETFMGDDIEVTLKITNTSSEDRTINGTFHLYSMYYTGVVYKEIETKKIDNFILKPNEETLKTIKVTARGYLDKLMDHCLCRLSSIFRVMETKQIQSEIDELRLRKPHLDVNAPKTGIVGSTFPVKVSFKNPLHVALTECELRVEAPHLQRPIVYTQKDVPPNETFTGSFDMTPAKAGEREMVIYFNCNHISSVTGSHAITIEGK